MSTDVLSRLKGTDPVAGEDLSHLAGGPVETTALSRLLERPSPRRRWRGREVVGTGLAIAGAVGALVAGVVLIPGSGPDDGAPVANSTGQTEPIPLGTRREVVDFFAGLRPNGPNGTVRPETARAVFAWASPYGAYSIWRARTVGPRGVGTLLVSPRAGGLSSFSYGIEQRLPRAPYLVPRGGGASSAGGYREVFGQASAQVATVRVRLADGRREGAELKGGWWVFTQAFGHAKPVTVQGLDSRGRIVVTTTKGLF